MKAKKSKKITYLITWVGGFIEFDNKCGKWNCSKVVKASKYKDLNEIISEVKQEVTSGAYKRFELINISVVK